MKKTKPKKLVLTKAKIVAFAKKHDACSEGLAYLKGLPASMPELLREVKRVDKAGHASTGDWYTNTFNPFKYGRWLFARSSLFGGPISAAIYRQMRRLGF